MKSPRAVTPESWRQKLYLTLSFPNYSRIAKLYSVFIAVCIIVSIVELVLSSYATIGSDERWGVALFIIDTVVSVIFTADYLLRLGLSFNKIGFVFNMFNIIDLLSFLPYYIELGLSQASGVKGLQSLRILRVLRLFRILKLSRNLAMLQILFLSLAEAWKGIFLLYFLLTLFALVAGSIMYYIETAFCSYDGDSRAWIYTAQVPEAEGEESMYQNILISMYWAFVTVTTVGYGDIAPRSWAGRLVGAVGLTIAIIVLALPITVIGSVFARRYDEMKANTKSGNIRFTSFAKNAFARVQGKAVVAEKDDEMTWDEFARFHGSSHMANIDNMLEQCDVQLQELQKRLSYLELAQESAGGVVAVSQVG
mmetsp:Transcript_7172/g.21876  ORF Transcript_7172/g.21876 Transcript_7172/m.21876 type:complete len:366 (+) Transcript_7172:183-1280(+)